VAPRRSVSAANTAPVVKAAESTWINALYSNISAANTP
jgi:hypothetical protein